jgi:hypothetical protein
MDGVAWPEDDARRFPYGKAGLHGIGLLRPKMPTKTVVAVRYAAVASGRSIPILYESA